jgi:hypothetical protein
MFHQVPVNFKSPDAFVSEEIDDGALLNHPNLPLLAGPMG